MHARGAIIDGIELDPVFAERSKPYCRSVYNVNLENIANLDLPGQYDIVVAADVLEHLKNPEEVLSKTKKYLKKMAG